MRSGNIQLDSTLKLLTHFIKRFHTLLFFLLVSASLFVAILMIISAITLSSTTASTSTQAVSGTFDEQTINRLQQSTSTPIKHSGRLSPFSE
jgi:hypothetical protein